MKILVIGANGKQGRLLTQKAEERGHEVVALSPDGMGIPLRGTLLKKSLFALTEADLADVDAVLSAFGSGFDTDPEVNRQAVDYLIDLIGQKRISLLILGGAGTLWSDETHRTRVFQTPEHPAFLRGISENLALAAEDLKNSALLDWSFVCPSLHFDWEGAETGAWQVGTEEVPLYNRNGESRISYRDFASAMIREAETREHRNRCITVCER